MTDFTLSQMRQAASMLVEHGYKDQAYMLLQCVTQIEGLQEDAKKRKDICSKCGDHAVSEMDNLKEELEDFKNRVKKFEYFLGSMSYPSWEDDRLEYVEIQIDRDDYYELGKMLGWKKRV